MANQGLNYSVLPTKAEELVTALDWHIDRELDFYSWDRVLHWLIHLYIIGKRDFKVLDWKTGRIKISTVDADGNFNFRHQKLTAYLNDLKGQFQGVNVWPLVEKRGAGIEAVRRRAFAQAVADSVTDKANLDRVFDHVLTNLMQMGCAAISSDVMDSGAGFLTAEHESVHPHELLPYPHIGHDRARESGIVRRRWVSLSFLKAKLDARKVAANIEKMELAEVNFGDEPIDRDGWRDFDNSSGTGGWTYSNSKKRRIGNEIPKGSEIKALLEEVWLYGPGRNVARYIVKCGGWIAKDMSYGTEENPGLYPCPISMERFLDDNTWYGQGPGHLLLHANREAELLLSRLFENVREIEQSSVLVMPRDTVDYRNGLHNIGKGMKLLQAEIDPSLDTFKPFLIQPHNSGDFPGKVAEFANRMMIDIVPLSPMAYGEAPGRVDSASGLQFIDQQSKIRFTSAYNAIERLFGNAHRYVTMKTSEEMADQGMGMKLVKMSEDMVGLVFDPETGEFMARNNVTPDPRGLDFKIIMDEPTYKLSLKREAIEMFNLNPDLIGLILFCLKNGLDLAMYTGMEEAAYRKAVFNLLVMFGDGETPGRIKDNVQNYMPDIQIRVMNTFMAGPEFVYASAAVQTEFNNYVNDLKMASGGKLPPGLPNPDDLAMVMGQPPSTPEGMSYGG